MTTLEIISAAKDVVLGLAAIGTVSVAVYGIKSWSRELRGKASFEVARCLIRATYKLRDELSYSRSPWMSPGEFPKEYSPMSKDSASTKEAEALVYVFTNRWKRVAKAQLEFEANVLEAEALWGSDIKTKTDKLRECARDLRDGMDAMLSNAVNDGEDFKCDPEFGEVIKLEVYRIKEATNKLSIEINNAVEEIEKSVRPHIKRN